MTKNPIHPKKLLLSKWTAAIPENKEKHFMVIKVIEPEVEGGSVEQVVIEAVMSKRQKTIHWRSSPMDQSGSRAGFNLLDLILFNESVKRNRQQQTH